MKLLAMSALASLALFTQRVEAKPLTFQSASVMDVTVAICARNDIGHNQTDACFDLARGYLKHTRSSTKTKQAMRGHLIAVTGLSPKVVDKQILSFMNQQPCDIKKEDCN